MPQSITNVDLIGAAVVTIGGVDVGHTDENGAKLTLANTLVEAMVGRYGAGVPVRKWLNGQRATVEFVLVQTGSNWSQLAAALPGANYVTDGATKHKLTFGTIAGTEITPVTFKLTSHIAANTPGFDLTAARAVPIGDFEILWSGGGKQAWTCQFEILIDEAGGADGSYLFDFGDTTATADAVAPTVSGVVPADAGPGIAVDTNVTWTLSENLDGNTVNNESVYLIEDPVGAGVGTFVAGTVTLTNSGAGTTIVFNPTANLTGGTQFLAVLTNDITDLAGNALAAGYITSFTTV
jgi:hypothetical protein